MLRTSVSLILLISSASLLSAAPMGLTLTNGSSASPLPTTHYLFWTTADPIDLYYLGSVASYSSSLYLDISGSTPSSTLLFTTGLSTPGAHTIVSPAASGVEARFRLEVIASGFTFVSGPASLNPDGQLHAVVALWSPDASLGVPGLFVGMEDWYSPSGGDFDYNDAMVVATGLIAHAPEPAGVGIVAGVLALAGTLLRRR